MKSYVIRRRFNPSLTTGSESVKIFLPKGFGTPKFAIAYFVNGGVGNFEVDYNAGNIIIPAALELKVTPSTANPITYKMLITVYAV